MEKTFRILFVAVVLLGVIRFAHAGPDFVEGPEDAGSKPGSAKPVSGGSGKVNTVSGNTGGPLAGGVGADLEDMYIINITDPADFRATTLNPDGSADFDTQLWLFEYPTGLGLLGNNDGQSPKGGGGGGSLLLPGSDDGTVVVIDQPGLYLLAVSGVFNEPQSDVGPIFQFSPANPFEISGPDGPGGSMPIFEWGPPGQVGSYTIALEGVDFINSTQQSMVAELRGGQEVPPVLTTARGCGRFVVDTDLNRLSFHISYGGLSSAETAAHIHGPALPGQNAGVKFALPPGSPKIGIWLYDESDEADILAGRMYVNIHSKNFPGGEIRGQINDFAAILDGQQENPSVPVVSEGWGTFNINTCTNRLSYHIVVESLSAAESAAHIHGFVNIGTNAGVQHTLPTGNVKTGVWTYNESQEPAILSGLTYVNIHSTAFPGGEIRGQIVNTVVPIDGQQEVPPTATSGYGCGFMAFDLADTSLGFYIQFAGLTTTETAAHIHGFAPPGMNAGVLFTLPLGTPKKGVWNYGLANQPNVLAGQTYVNIHSTQFPGGEIRGQIIPPIPKCLGDVNCDGLINVDDLLAVINAWGPCTAPPAPCPADINYSGTVNVDDLLAVINAWGRCR